MRQRQIDELLRILDDVFEQLGGPGGYDEAVGAIESAMIDPRPEKAIVVQIGMIVAGQLFRVLA